MTDQISDVAYEARDLARQAMREIGAHEDVCAERYKAIGDKLGMLFKIIAWAGGASFLLIMGLLSYLAKTQFENMTAFQRALDKQQIGPALPPQIIIQPSAEASRLGATVAKQPAP